MSIVLIFVGVMVFATQKYIDKTEEREFSSSDRSGHAMPGDIHGHTGWDKGGRSESWSSNFSDGGDGGGD